jgi:hypothetical protein
MTRHTVVAKGVLWLVAGTLAACAGCGRQGGAFKPTADYAYERVYTDGALSVKVRLSSTKTEIAHLVHFEIEAVTEPGYTVVFPNVAEALTGLEMRDQRAANERFDERNRIVRTRRYCLEPVSPGAASIGAISFECGKETAGRSAMETLTTDPIEIKVVSLLDELGTQLVIEDIESVVDLRAARWPWWAGGVAIAAVAAAVLWRRSRRSEAAQIARIFRPAHEIAYEILRQIAEDRLVEAGRVREFYGRLTNCLRHYIEHRFQLRAPEQTTEEFLAEAEKADALAGRRSELQNFMEHCDLVKFARYEPSAEQINAALGMVQRFVDATRSDECRVEVRENAGPEGQ